MKVGDLIETTMGNIAMIISFSYNRRLLNVIFVEGGTVRYAFPEDRVKRIINEDR